MKTPGQFGVEINTGWRAADSEQARWVRQPAERIEVSLPVAVIELFRERKLANPAATCLGDLWDATWSSTPEIAVHEELADVLPRVTPAMFSNLLSQRVFERSGDSVLVRLMESHPQSGLPGATAYASWTADYINGTLNEFLNWLLDSPISPGAPESFGLLGLGSRLDVIESLLVQAIQAMPALSLPTSGEETLNFHNGFAQNTLLKFYGGTGSRPLVDPAEDPRHFDLVAMIAYVNDKASGKARSGRLVNLPPGCAFAVKAYMRHLGKMADAVSEAAPEFAEELRKLARGIPSKRLPFFFLLRSENGRLNWISASERNLTAYGRFDVPLPLNLFRHRLANRLRALGVDPELIDAHLGHAEAGAATHGDYSCRVWSDDTASLREPLQRAFDALSFPDIDVPDQPYPPVSLRTDPLDEPRLFGQEARARERRQRVKQALLTGRSILDTHLRGRQLIDLDRNEIAALSRALVTNASGLPHPHAALRFSVLVNAAEKQFKETRKKVHISRHYRQLEEESSPFTAEGIGAPTASKKIRTLCEAIASTRPEALGNQDATILAAVLVIAQSRIADQRLLTDLAESRNLRLVRARTGLYLEQGIDLRSDDPSAAVRRFRVSDVAAKLIEKALARKQIRSIKGLPIPELLRPVAAALEDEGRLHRDAKASNLLACIARLIDQANAQEFPGVVAAFLSGRIQACSLGWRDWMRLRWDVRLDCPELAEQADAIVPNMSLPRTPAQEADLEVLQKSSADLFAAVREQLNRGTELSGTAPATKNLRRDIKAGLRDLIRSYDGVAPKACLFLVSWALDLMDRRTGHGDYLARGALLRYFGALSPSFEAVAYEIDLELADEEEITDFYEEVLLARPGRDLGYVRPRLREFHRWLAGQIDVEDPIWSDLPNDDGGFQSDPGIVVEKDYLRAVQTLWDTPGDDIDSRRSAFVLIGAYRYGMRGGEALNLLRRDCIALGSTYLFVIQNNRHRRLKRPASRRVVPQTTSLTPTEKSCVEWAIADAESRFGNDKSRLLFGELTRVAQHRLKRGAISALKVATGNPETNLHRLRHAAANRISLQLSGFSLPAWSAAWTCAGGDRDATQMLLLGRPGVTRRVAWATARFLGHSGPGTSHKSYLHYISDLAEHCVGLEESPSSRVESAIDLESLPVKELDINTAPECREEVKRGFAWFVKSLRLLARGKSISDVAKWMGWEVGDLKAMERLLASINARMRFVERANVPVDPRLEWTRRITNDGWNRLLNRAEAIDASGWQKELIGPGEVAKMIGSSRQVLAWKESHFLLLDATVSQWNIERKRVTAVMAGKNEAVRRLATDCGWGLEKMEDLTKRKRGLQIDVACDDEHQLLRVTSRVAFLLKEQEGQTVNNRYEMLVALLATSVKR